MSNQPENLNLLSDLIVRALHNDLDPAGIDRLNSLLQNSAAARGFYLDFMANQATMRKACGSILNNTNTDNIPQCPDTAFQEVVFEDLEDSAIRRAIALAESECENEEPQPAPKTSLQRRKLTANDWGRILMKTAAIVLLCLSVLWLDRWIMRERRHSSQTGCGPPARPDGRAMGQKSPPALRGWPHEPGCLSAGWRLCQNWF